MDNLEKIKRLEMKFKFAVWTLSQNWKASCLITTRGWRKYD